MAFRKYWVSMVEEERRHLLPKNQANGSAENGRRGSRGGAAEEAVTCCGDGSSHEDLRRQYDGGVNNTSVNATTTMAAAASSPELNNNPRRIPVSQDEFYEVHQFHSDDQPGRLKKFTQNCSCSGSSLLRHVKKLIPILRWLPHYNYRDDFLVDFTAGITLAVVQIPQAMAFAMLSTASPVLGLYATFFASALYFILGTSKFSSLGMAGVTALVVGEAINEQLDLLHVDDDFTIGDSVTAAASNETLIDTELFKTQIATTMAFIVGILQVIMGLLNLGTLSVLFSDVMMRACTMAAVTQMIISQVPHLLGFKIHRHSGPLSTVYNIVDIGSGLPRVNVATILTSICSLAFLILINEGINARYKHKLKIPIPAEIVLIALATSVSYFVGFHDNYGVNILHFIPTGLPIPTPPRFDMIPSLIPKSIVVTILTFTIIMSQAKVLSSKYECFPDISQELFANGVANILGSFFSALPCSFAFVRCMLLIHLKARSLMCSLICAITLLITLLYFAPVFEPLPHCILGSILVFALAEILLDLKLIPKTWKSVKTDSFVITISYLSVLLLDLQFGIAVGMVVSMLMVLFKTMRIQISTLGIINDTDVYLDIKKFKKARELDNIKIFHVGGSLFFGTKDMLKKKIEKHVLNVEKKKLHKANDAKANNVKYPEMIYGLDISRPQSNGLKTVIPIEIPVCLPKFVILDLSVVTFVDTSALRTVGVIKEELDKVNAKLLLAACTNKVMKAFQTSEVKNKVVGLFYPTVHDAVLAAQLQIAATKTLMLSSCSSSAQEAYDNPSFIHM